MEESSHHFYFQKQKKKKEKREERLIKMAAKQYNSNVTFINLFIISYNPTSASILVPESAHDIL